ncbi:MAG: efflux RND transporter permease subunit [Burkholderiales bacterium]|nr:MAG: efflux RND transporter permease subunit [Burkholderiales bacterium]
MRSFNLSEWAVRHPSMVLFLILATLLAGAFSFTRLGQSEDPQFNVPSMTIVVGWPGATTREVHDHLINPIEQALQDIGGVDNIRSFSRQGYGGLTLWMKGRLSKAELDAIWYQARKKVGDIRDQLPPDVRGPFFNDEFTDVYTTLYAVQSSDLGTAELQEVAELIKRRLQTVPDVAKVNVLGKQKQQVFVNFSSQKLAALGVSPQLIIQALARQNQVTPSGFQETSEDRVHVLVSGGFGSLQDVRDVQLPAGGKVLRLGDIATVQPGYEDPPAFTIRHQGQPALAIGVTMMRQANIQKLGEALAKKMAEVRSELPAGITVSQYADQPSVVKSSVWEFERSFLEALAIVLAVCFAFLGWRTGIVVAASIPLVLGLVAIVMYAMDWSLDRISLGALIIALGLLVDDAIIAVEMMVVKMEQGWDRVRAATFAYTSTAFPMLTGTLVTVAGFMPVGFAKSTSGEYAGGIFWIVGLALMVSWVVAVVFTPYLGVKLLPAHMHQGQHNPYDRPIYTRLRRWVDAAVAHRWAVITCTAVAFLVAGAGMGLVQQQFFPTASRPELLVELRLREGASFRATQAEVQKLEKLLKADVDIQHFTAYTGAGSPRFYLSLSPELPNPGYAQFVIMTRDLSAREAVRSRLLQLFKTNEQFPSLRGRVARLEFGPPVGFPVQFRVIGPNTHEVRRIAERVRTEMAKSPLIRDPQLDWGEQVRVQRVKVDQEQVAHLGLSSTDVAQLIQTTLQGAPVTQMRRGEELVDVVVRAGQDERQHLERLQDIQLVGPQGQSVALSQVAHIEADFDEPVIQRRNRETTLTVRADLADDVQGPYASGQIEPTLSDIRKSLPLGYRIEAGGAVEESSKANVALFAIFPIMFLAMLFVLMVQLQSFSRMWLVFMTAPLGIIGVVPALLIFHAPFGFVALLGVIALGGMIMRNAVILVDQIDHDILEGTPAWQAIVEATVRRARPVVLTAAAAILAMVPLSRSVFWGPMAIAIMGGLVVATALTLVFVPALYAAWFKVQRPTNKETA